MIFSLFRICLSVCLKTWFKPYIIVMLCFEVFKEKVTKPSGFTISLLKCSPTLRQHGIYLVILNWPTQCRIQGPMWPFSGFIIVRRMVKNASSLPTQKHMHFELFWQHWKTFSIILQDGLKVKVIVINAASLTFRWMGNIFAYCLI